MQLHELKSLKKKKGKRVGRGGKKGTYSGKGIKGQKSRAGRKLEPPIRGIIKKYHKLRGYNFNPLSKEKIVAVNVGVLAKNFEDNETISPEILVEKGLIRKMGGRIPKIKILGKGEAGKPLNVKGCLLSGSAAEKIKKAGGKIEN